MIKFCVKKDILLTVSDLCFHTTLYTSFKIRFNLTVSDGVTDVCPSFLLSFVQKEINGFDVSRTRLTLRPTHTGLPNLQFTSIAVEVKANASASPGG